MPKVDVIVGVVTTTENSNQLAGNISSGDTFGIINSAGQVVASAVGATPFGFGLTIASNAITFYKIQADYINGKISSGDILDLTAGALGIIASGAVIVGVAAAVINVSIVQH